MMMTDNDILYKQFEAITAALDEDLPYKEFRKKLFDAYLVTENFPAGIEDPHEAIAVTKSKELEFAKRCLEGRGPNANQIFRETGDLRELLLIEIGTHHRRPTSPARPWLMGDWQILAERIVDAILSSDGFNESSDIKRHRSREVVRVWPTRGKWKEDPRRKVKSKGSQVEVKLDRTDVASNGPIMVRSFTDKYESEEYNWIILPTGPGALGIVSQKDDGIPAHLWTGFRVDDGT